MLYFFFLLALLGPHNVHSSDNGLARTPPMGWLSWSSFKCEVDCKKYPTACINDKLYETTADAMVNEGFLKAGYNYVNIDDCWSLKERDPKTLEMVPDATRFPKGIKGVSDYIHSKGLKFGLYSDIGTKTCAGYPGHLNEKGKSPRDFFDIDSKSFSDWEIDSLKVDGCNIPQTPQAMDPEYVSLSKSLNKTNRPIVLFCSGPFFQGTKNKGKVPADQIDYARYSTYCNGWRYFEDIWPNWFNRNPWESILDIIDFYKENVGVYENYQKPGSWFDPDALIIGNGLLTKSQEEAHMAIWAIMGAPLIMSNDVRNMSTASKEILLNEHVIAIDQDPLGIAGKPVIVDRHKEIWVKKLAGSDYSVVFFNRGTNAQETFSYPLRWILDIQENNIAFHFYDLFNGNKHGPVLKSQDMVNIDVPPNGVRMFKVVKG